MAISWQLLGDFVAILGPFFQRLARSACDVNTKHDSNVTCMEMDVETTQIAVACLGIGTVILCRRPKKRRERKIWVKPWISANMY